MPMGAYEKRGDIKAPLYAKAQAAYQWQTNQNLSHWAIEKEQRWQFKIGIRNHQNKLRKQQRDRRQLRDGAKIWLGEYIQNTPEGEVDEKLIQEKLDKLETMQFEIETKRKEAETDFCDVDTVWDDTLSMATS